ncbi:hypothetical protein EI42_05911 [Thermosporothrix hazakensis]|uniref:Uncharacterized protein n=1 Tax=Thermosporothrix hazakensis TaxID=644383 RepID=A0A326U894_THEHA|nr:hypothetical protein EI42_05911 [Thermosporothrix hazakensis]GCE51465.1 hypothetical protein KTH_63340 [Thermosporothrix hazakensis]
MRFIGATEVSTDTACQLMDREQTSRLNDGTLAMHPFGFDGVEPRALFGQKQGQDAHAFARLLDLLVLFSDPGSHQRARHAKKRDPRSRANGVCPLAPIADHTTQETGW